MPEQDTRCPITELRPAECAHCRKLPDLGLRLLGESFTASFPGRCSACQRGFAAGRQIRRDLEDGKYVADCCWHLADRM